MLTMSAIQPLYPRQSVPKLCVPTVSGKSWDLTEHLGENFTLIVFYRGLHCPICSRYLGDLNHKLDKFAARGTAVIAISGDDRERAGRAREDWNLDQLTIGYGMSLDNARKWGLFISSGRGKTSTGHAEPALFFEPGLFLVRNDGTLYFGSVQTMPFARPSFTEVLGALDFVLTNDYPARGEVLDHNA